MSPVATDKRRCGHKFILRSCDECARYLDQLRRERFEREMKAAKHGL